jgi:glycogen(starch) synthase
VRGHFFGSHAFDLEETLYFFFAGRYEYRNKGLDLFIEALYRLNGHLQHIGSPKTVVAFIIAPAPTVSINVDVLNNQAMLRELSQLCDELTEDMGRRVFAIASTGRQPDLAEILTERDVVRLRRMIYTRRKSTLPPIVTHNMANDAEDEILQHLRHRSLYNNKHDRVKVVFHPEFLSSTSPLLGMDYEEFLRGCHLGVFPSYYEPWGYTPAECTVTGVPSVTSNLSGFGTFIVGEVPDHTRRGIYVIDRRTQPPGLALDELTQILIEFCSLNRRERITLRNRTERLSDLLDWSHLGQEYHKAHDLALQRAYDITLV